MYVYRYITVPGPPTDVKVLPVNSTTIHVQWRPPTEEDRHGIIRGYHIHVQEAKPEVSVLSPDGYKLISIIVSQLFYCLPNPLRFSLTTGQCAAQRTVEI